MQIDKSHRSPHFNDIIIPVEFVVLHYTAQSLKTSLNIFLSPKPSVSCHLLIDRDGSIYELVECLEGRVKKAFHAGQSLWQGEADKKWESFNGFSIGIELVNWNGNIFPYPDKQYQSLFQVLTQLKTQFPQLKKPERVVGHEHVAGFRGKKDPGGLFDWPSLFKNVYGNENQSCYIKKPENFKNHLKENQESNGSLEAQAENKSFPLREPALTKKQIKSLEFLKNLKKWNDKKAKKASLILENNRYPFWLKKWILFFIFR